MSRRRKQVQEPLRLLQAAVALGQEEALEAALGYWLEDEAIAGNRRLSAARVTRELVPAGRLLADEKVPVRFLARLARHRLAAFRAMAAAAWAFRFLHGPDRDAARDWLTRLSRDDREEVREAMRVALLEGCGEGCEGRVLGFVRDWLHEKGLSPKTKAIALALLRAMVTQPEDVAKALDLIEKARLPRHESLREAWVTTLAALGRLAPDVVLDRFGRWLLARPRWAPWMAQALARKWAAQRPTQVLHLLEAMTHRWGRRKCIVQALQGLVREGVLEGDEVQRLLSEWLHEEPDV